jgi:sigma-B regulation protein RsbU (phosphoserine phosphatase)
VVADVSGKGLPAALVMTITKGLLLAASDDRAEPLAIAQEVNAGVHSLRNRSLFVTMLLGVLDPAARSFRFVRAGHTPLFWRHADGSVEMLAPRGLGLGMAPAAAFARVCQERTIEVAPGDLLLLFSDGVTEAMNERREELGEERLVAFVRERLSPRMTAEEICAAVIAEVDHFRGAAAAHDDMTLVVVRC